MLAGILGGDQLELSGSWRIKALFDRYDEMRQSDTPNILPLNNVWQRAAVHVNPATGYIEVTFPQRDIFEVVNVEAYVDETGRWHIDDTSSTSIRLRLAPDADITAVVEEARLGSNLHWGEDGPGVFTFYDDDDGQPNFALDYLHLRRKLTLEDVRALQRGRGISMEPMLKTRGKPSQTDELRLPTADRERLLVALDQMLERGVIS